MRTLLVSAAAAWLVVVQVLNLPLLAVHAAGRNRQLAASTVKPVFMEYIGGGGAALTDVPVIDSADFDFYFILAFAVDTDGNFTAGWQPRLSPANIAAVKSTHPNVKFSVSIGGGNPSAIFQPSSIDSWVETAVITLSSIITDYHAEGIDIDYESFSNSANDFATCIGELITQLKQKNLITFASIAPYPGTDTYYTTLWSSYNGTIDYVNYQFYSEGNMPVSAYVDVYESAKEMYGGGRCWQALRRSTMERA